MLSFVTRITTLIFVLCVAITAQGQFTLLTNELKGSREGDVTWADFDSDGDIDILIIGNDIDAVGFSRIYRNDDLIFTELDVENFPVLFDGSVDWADYNNDGQQDLALIAFSTTDGTVISRIYTFDGGFKDTEIQLHGVTRGSIDWGDYNQDGFADLLIVGQDIESESVTKLYKYTSEGFIEVSLPEVTGVSFGDAAWADVNGDGKLDFIISGVTGVAPDTGLPITQIYLNTGEGFEKTVDLPGVREGSVDWGDADNDGDLDLLLTGLLMEPEPAALTALYLNDNGTFTDALIDFPFILEGFAKWGDYDNDGDLDVLLVGNPFGSIGKVFKVFENNSLVFTEIFDASGVGQASGGWGDLNGDGYLDIFINGQEDDSDIIGAIYLNDLGDSESGRLKSTNTPPSVPVKSSVFVSGSTAKLSWNDSEDDSTPSTSLSYNIGVYKGDKLIISSQSSSSGKLSLVEPGNAGLNTYYKVTGLSNGTYRWAVQAIDNSFTASSFSTEGTFVVDGSIVTDLQDMQKEVISIYPNPAKDYIRLACPQGSMLNLYDLTGREVNVVLESEYLRLEHLKQGVYILKVSAGKNVATYKIIKD